MNDSRGSVWRRWDLHIHSPFSHLHNGFGSDFDLYVKSLFKAAIENGVEVIGVTDYFTIDGYKKIKTDYLENPNKLSELFNDEEIEKIKEILVLPNVEFRLDKLVDGNRINYHVIFSDEVSIEDIEEHFLHEIDFVYEGNPQSEDEKWKLKSQHIEALGRKLKEDHADFRGEQDMFIGMKCAVVDDNQITNLLVNKRSKFAGKYLLVAPSDEDLSTINWNSQGHQIRKVLVQKADILFASNPNTINWGLGQLSTNTDEYIKEFKSLKPCVWGSDAHTYEELFRPNQDRFCWIKADKSFDGLLQILIEPADRVYIGEIPPGLLRVQQNRTKYMKELIIKKLPSSALSEKWFEELESIPLNSDLIAIIGNKGSGKSALADIIGLVGNTHNDDGFSFLHPKKFRAKRPNRSEHFQAEIMWKNGLTDGPKLLSLDTDKSLEEKVKYIPQSYLETLCTETDENKFSEELKKVIFSHVDESEKLGKHSLDELVEYKSEEISKGIARLKIELAELNTSIEGLESKSTVEYRSKIEDSLKLKKEELEAHKKVKPPEMKEPKKDDSLQKEQGEISVQLAQLKQAQKELKEKIEAKRDERKSLALRLAKLRRFEQSLANFMEEHSSLKEQYVAELADFGLQFDEIVKLTVKKQPVDKLIKDTTSAVEKVDKDLDEKQENSLQNKYAKNHVSIKELQGKLDEPTRKFQENQDQLKAWQEKEKEIIGSSDVQGTIKFYEGIIMYLDKQLATDLATYKQKRADKVKSIYSEKSKVVEVYRDLYRPVTEFIQEYQNLMKDYEINLDVSIQLSGFEERFFEFVSRGSKGSFIGTEDGLNALRQLTEGVNFNSVEAVLSFLGDVLFSMEHDKRTQNDELRRVRDQLRQGVSSNEFYDFIFSLDYLRPDYKLKLGSKNISELSPGERGALLLIFYLLLDKQDIPLIIDQPEENLDNQSVYGFLVKFIKEAKKKRQIVIVTHNPNIAVVCDAEQVIHVRIEKERQNRVLVSSGGIENPVINSRIVEILEGTFPAFDNRTEKYKVSKRR